MELEINMEELQPVTLLARNWTVGKCLGKVTEEYAEFITANRDLVRAISSLYTCGVDDKVEVNRSIDLAKHGMIMEAIDLMTSLRTLLWKMGVDDNRFKKYVVEVNVKNRDRGYF